MYIQFVLKGIEPVPEAVADDMLLGNGIRCNWWRRVGTISPHQMKEQLTDRNLDWHLNHYDDFDPTTGDSFKNNTPFVSTTAGSVERDVFLAANVVHPPFMTALRFATDDFGRDGYVYYGYVFTLGKKAVEAASFAEEVRDLLVYSNYLPFHHEGELVAKIYIPSVQLEKYEVYDGKAALADLRRGLRPTPRKSRYNPSYQPPQQYSNIREMVL